MHTVAGKGAYGTVVKARDTTTGLDVAIKVIPLTDTDPAELKTIQKEINFLSQCSHPNVVKYIVGVVNQGLICPELRLFFEGRALDFVV